MHKPLVVITGASSGIGASLAQVFADAGYPLALLARNVPAMQALQLPQALCLEADVTDPAAMEKALMQATAQFGPVDCLINNAGYAKDGEFSSMPHSVHDTIVQSNVMGIINGIELVLPNMQQRKGGTIINISSLADRNARPHLATYAASKAAVKSLTESLRMANAKYGIRICNVAPAKIKTPALKASNLSPDQLIEVDQLARIILWIYQQPQGLCVRDIVVAPTFYEL